MHFAGIKYLRPVLQHMDLPHIVVIEPNISQLLLGSPYKIVGVSPVSVCLSKVCGKCGNELVSGLVHVFAEDTRNLEDVFPRCLFPFLERLHQVWCESPYTSSPVNLGCCTKKNICSPVHQRYIDRCRYRWPRI